MKKFFSLLLVLMLTTSLIAGCSKKDETAPKATTEKTETTPEATSKPTSKPITLSMIIATSWNTDALTAGIAAYEKETGNKIEIESVPDDQLTDLVSTRLATEADIPDIYVGNDEFVYDQIKTYFEPLSGDWIAKLDPTHLEAKYQRPEDNQVYAAPYGSSTALGLIYNKKIFADNGIQVPIMTFSDLLKACKTLKAAGVEPFSISNKEGWTAQILGLDQEWEGFTDDQFTALKEGKLNYKDVTSLQTLFSNMRKLVDMGYVNKDYMSTTMDMSIADVATGVSAMTPAGDWSFAAAKSNYPDQLDNIGMIPIPIRDESIYVNIGTSSKYFWATKKGKAGNPEAAKEFINYMMSDKTLQAMYAVEPGICPIQGLNVEQNAWDKEMLSYTSTIPYAKIYTQLAGFNTGDFAATVQSLFGGYTVDQALKFWYDDCAKKNKAEGKSGF